MARDSGRHIGFTAALDGNGRGALLRPILFAAALVGASGVLLNMVVRDLGAPPEGSVLLWWSLVPVFFAAEWYALGARGRSRLAALSSHDAALVLGLVLAFPLGLIGAQLGGAALAWAAIRPGGIVRAIVRLGTLAIATSVALVLFHLVLPLGDPRGPAGWLAGTVAAIAASLTMLGLSAASTAAGADRAAGVPARVLVALAAGGAVASAALALVAVELLREEEAAALLLVVPFAFSMVVLRAYVSERRRHEDMRALYGSMRIAHREPGPNAGVTDLLASTRRLLRADVAWMALLPRDSSAPTFVAESTAVGATELQPSVITDGEAAVIAEAVQSSGAVAISSRRASGGVQAFLATRGLRTALVAGLRGDAGALGVVVVGNVDEVDFADEDARLLETYASHAAVLMEHEHLEQSLHEVTVLKEQLRHQAYHDALTGLPNRVLFTEHVARALASPTELGRPAVLFLDLDDFKIINDSFGHMAGDDLLIAVAERVTACVRPLDVPARLGGDEFAVLARGAREEDAERLAERLVHALAEPFVVEGREMNVHASVGIAFGDPGDCSADELLRNADVAMYDAKQAGKRRFARYQPQMHERVRSRHELASALERAVHRGEIAVHYQPIVELCGRRLVAIEALARWERVGHGLVQPGAFIPLADEIGLMVEIGRVVLKEACKQARAWQDVFPGHAELMVNVNLAPSELQNAGLPDEVARLLEDTGLAPERLVLELTESGVMRRPAEARATMRNLRALGVSLALDDFGTGHSSLAHLREFPIDTLKIAKPFVAGLPDGHVDKAFVQTIVHLAHSLELGVVAEGIESGSQAQAVADLGCSLGQGYYFGEPLSQIGVTRYLTTDVLPPPRPAPGLVAA
jgi:diguanylate cyclase (GGDEF)-like protein